jgi:hypothetical protein
MDGTGIPVHIGGQWPVASGRFLLIPYFKDIFKLFAEHWGPGPAKSKSPCPGRYLGKKIPVPKGLFSTTGFVENWGNWKY